MALDLESKIEGLLFYKGEEMSFNKLSELFNVSIDEIKTAIEKLDISLASRGLVLVFKDDKVVLGINGELSPLIESIRKEEITKELSKASLETLSIILYKNGISRSEIDHIRGVNSSFILRNLLVRDLIEKVIDIKDNRKILYQPTFNTLSYMGIKSIKELPKYEETIILLNGVINENLNNE